MDIDKDIEYLKGYKYDNEVKQAIEKVLWALSGKDCVIETQAHNEEVLEEYIAKLEKELETYKKIAEKFALTILEIDVEEKDVYETICKSTPNNRCEEFGNGNCTQCIIEWARKEVENGR